ncbi:hypothetical protein CANINC_002927 [Pichia inconspicua]|uniref:Manganese resistance protein MNR2 n=1 Tax=Pichia inconspicua TaxID=52247 RepID=A0A4T0X019_9ASCO|nr:hypothetical protein CANINC_002927 [[Candida] inconspicua]
MSEQDNKRENINYGQETSSKGKRNSISSLHSSETREQHLAELHGDEVIDAMGLIENEMNENNTGSGIQSTNPFSDHRKISDISLDQKVIRPIKHSNDKPMNSMIQQSQALLNTKDRNGRSTTEHNYGSINLKTSSKVSHPTSNFNPITSTFNNPFAIQNQRKSVAQRSLLSQSLPISNFTESLHNESEDGDSLYASSNPSSRRASNTSSLNDVCFPVDSLNEVDRSKKWPNLDPLKEFIKTEIEERKRSRSSTPNMTSDIEENDGAINNVNFEYPIISNIEDGNISEPLLIHKEEETDLIDGRLRSRKHPMNKPFGKNDKMKNMRFTYFRESMTSTISSPNLSGLTHNGLSLEELFVPRIDNSGTSLSNEDKDTTLHKNSTIPSLASKTTLSGQDSGSNVIQGFAEPFWLDVMNPTEDEMKVISKTFGIHPLTSEDIFLGEAREKVELFRDYYFVCFTSFDVENEHQMRKKAARRAFEEAKEEENQKRNEKSFLGRIFSMRRRKSGGSSSSSNNSVYSRSSKKSKKSQGKKSLMSKKRKTKQNKEDLVPLSMYIVVFKDGVITFHFKQTPHTGNVRRRARLLKDYLTISSDWVCYALIDDITDAFGPLIEAIEYEVNAIEDEIITMQSGKASDSEEDSSDSDDDNDNYNDNDNIWFKLKRRNSNVNGDNDSIYTKYSTTSSSSSKSSVDTKIISWKKKGDMLKRIGDCRRRVMFMLRLLGFKADVIKGFSKRCNEQWEVAPRSEIGLYLGDIQDHIVTMVQNLNHYEKLLARSHSNYLAQINIDMTKVNNDMNDILGKITVLGTIVLPLNIITGLWGMNCLVPGQDRDDLQWFWGICLGMLLFSVTCYFYVQRLMNIY